ncbi:MULTISPECIES: tyrosine-type recombinase/integrase [Frankia]|uniref:tyrosine-type recombinase/integrase n=1 Tax=Frankia TaxID=1854 RepID=UPI002100A3F4|nr:MULTISPECIES: tyrosine-type recombinase/integrase [Frankia]
MSRRRLHDLRHSSASIQLAEGVDITLVSKRHGHSSTRITGDLYAHLLRSTGRAAAEAIANAVPRAHVPPTTIKEHSGDRERNA